MSCRCSVIIANALGVISSWLILLTPAAIAAQALQPPTPLVVVDAHGKQLGQVVGVEAGHRGPSLIYVAVRLQVGAHTFVLSVHRDRLLSNTTAPVFASDDCSGQPFLTKPVPDATLPTVAVVGPQNTVYLAEPEATPQTITAKSRLAIDGTCLREFDAAVSEQSPALKLIELGGHFTPPFHVR